jgi:hypothetical protein
MIYLTFFELTKVCKIANGKLRHSSLPNLLSGRPPVKKVEGFPNYLSHWLFKHPSNNRELSTLMKDLLIALAISTPFHQSAEIVKENLDQIFIAFPKAKEDGFYSISASTISAFLATPEARGAISLAKNEPWHPHKQNPYL